MNVIFSNTFHSCFLLYTYSRLSTHMSKLSYTNIHLDFTLHYHIDYILWALPFCENFAGNASICASNGEFLVLSPFVKIRFASLIQICFTERAWVKNENGH